MTHTVFSLLQGVMLGHWLCTLRAAGRRSLQRRDPHMTQPSWVQLLPQDWAGWGAALVSRPAWSGTRYSPAEAWDGVTQTPGLRPMGTAVFRAASLPEDFGLLPSHCLPSRTWPWLVLGVTYADLSRREGAGGGSVSASHPFLHWSRVLAAALLEAVGTARGFVVSPILTSGSTAVELFCFLFVVALQDTASVFQCKQRAGHPSPATHALLCSVPESP